MWGDALLFLVGVAVWFRPQRPLPASDVEMVVQTYLVLEQPLPTITVVVTETVGGESRLTTPHFDMYDD